MSSFFSCFDSLCAILPPVQFCGEGALAGSMYKGPKSSVRIGLKEG